MTLAGGSAAPSPNASLANEDPAGALEQLVDTPEVERAAQWWLTQAIALDEAGEGSSTVATALAHMADAPDLAVASVPVHLTESFTDGADGPAMDFDYTLRPGIATSTNALKLMALVGLPLDTDDITGD